jgi:UDP-N-acetyl-D-mannosaminuronic acid dehydrogenase
LRPGTLVVLESSSPVGTTRQLAKAMAELRPDLRFPLDGETAPNIYLAYCPERIIPGQMLRELVENDRIIGGMSDECTERAAALYATFVKGQCLRANDRTAELCKLTENAFRDVNIAFANELSMVCDDIGIDAWKVIELANHHPRVSILNPGAGVGGHCIAVDPWFIVASAPERARLMRTAREVNDSKPEFILAKIARILEQNPGARIACLGLAYKPDVDDFRESPALEIALRLSAKYPENVVIADPFAFALSGMKDPRVAKLRVESAEDAVGGADVVLMLVGHSAFRNLSRPQGVELIDAVGFWR